MAKVAPIRIEPGLLYYIRLHDTLWPLFNVFQVTYSPRQAEFVFNAARLCKIGMLQVTTSPSGLLSTLLYKIRH